MSDISGEVQGTQPQGNETPEVTQQQSTTDQAAPGQGPWAKDLEGLGLPPEYQQAVDKYLREKWQPRVTELEQQYAPYKVFQSPDDGATAADLLYSLRENPQETYKVLGQLIEEQYGPMTDAEKKEAVDQVVSDSQEQQPQKDDPRLDYVDQLMQERELEQQMEDFQKLYEEQKQQFPELEEEWFAKLVLANNGDVENAMADYAKLFPKQESEPPPPTIGEGATTPPESEEWDSSKESFESFVKRTLAPKR